MTMKRLIASAAILAVLVAAQPTTALETRVTVLESKVATLQAQVAALQGAASPAPSVTPSARPSSSAAATPVPTPTATARVSGPINVTTNDVTIDGVTISGTPGSGYGIQALGTAASPIRNLTIRNCTITGFNTAILINHATNLTVENCRITDAAYAGVLILSTVGGSVSRNTIQRIGPQTIAWSGEINAYGIAFSNYDGQSLTTDMVADGNVIEDIPVWMGINSHSGRHLTWTNNVTRRVRRAFFAAPVPGFRVEDMVIRGNRAEALAPGTIDPTAFFISESDRSAVTGNVIDRSYPVGADGGEWLNYVRDYLARSTNLIRTGNVRP